MGPQRIGNDFHFHFRLKKKKKPTGRELEIGKKKKKESLYCDRKGFFTKGLGDGRPRQHLPCNGTC